MSSQKAIARAAGVSQSAVSLALRGSREISKAQQARICRIAIRLGYRPFAAAQRMAARKTGKSPQGMVLAWINREDTKDFWTRHPISRAYWRGAFRQAGHLGFRLDAFWLGEPGMTARRLADILYHRGIEGILFPSYSSSAVRVDKGVWRKFEAVSLNHPIHPPVADHVCADFLYNMDLCMERILRKGPARIGLSLKDVFDRETASASRSRFLFHTASLPRNFRIPPLVLPDVFDEKIAGLRRWLDQWKPEILLVRDYEIPMILESCGVRRKPRVLQLQMNEKTAESAGVDEKNEEIGAAAIELLGAKLLHGGSRPSFRTLLIKGVWKDAR